jgi:hypothetical protein
MMFIKNPTQLKEAIETSKEKSKYFEAVNAIAKYKWYNYYQHSHIKKGSEEDIQNEKIFEEIQVNHPKLHADVEAQVDWEIMKIQEDLD